MRKTIGSHSEIQSHSSPAETWFDLERIATVVVPSEDSHHPFEDALSDKGREGWKAAMPGRQTLLLEFDIPQNIRHIRLQFREEHIERTQEFVLFATCVGQSRKEVVRQQWTFSPNGSVIETEDYSVNLSKVSSIEIQIDPGRHDRQMIATLHSMKIA